MICREKVAIIRDDDECCGDDLEESSTFYNETTMNVLEIIFMWE